MSKRGTRLDQQARLFGGLLVFLVVGQRLAVPFGSSKQIPLGLPVGLAFVAYASARHLVRVDRSRLLAGMLALLAVTSCWVLALSRGRSTSTLSLVYLITTYVPFVFVLTGHEQRALGERLLDKFLRIMEIVALVAMLQILAQLAGYRVADPIGSVIPSKLLLQNYHTTYPLYYGSSLYKSNAYIFLEPSFLSQFLGVAILIRLVRGGRIRRILPLVVAMVATVAGTGFLLAIAGGLALLATRGYRRQLMRVVPIGAAVAVAASFTPFGATIISRFGESGGGSNSSAGLRFQLPYQYLGSGWLSDLPHALFGDGPGSADRFLTAKLGADIGGQVTPQVPLKLLFEYGLVGTAAFLFFLLSAVFLGRVSTPVTVGLVVAYLFLSGSLLQPATVLLMWVLSAVAGRPGVVAPRPRAVPALVAQPA
ncbi:MAG TPA: hypothetical protein VHE83_13605 [Mycobacteriales bacterium]|nr:hypothetical protein [Mycobacteriales bacterium]